jgi:hypothetical protein
MPLKELIQRQMVDHELSRVSMIRCASTENRIMCVVESVEALNCTSLRCMCNSKLYLVPIM